MLTCELTFADVRVDLLGQRAYVAGRDIGLSAKEMRLLTTLAAVAPEPVLVWDLWIEVIGREMPTNPDLWSNTVPVHISRLRDKLVDRSLIVTATYGYALREAVTLHSSLRGMR